MTEILNREQCHEAAHRALAEGGRALATGGSAARALAFHQRAAVYAELAKTAEPSKTADSNSITVDRNSITGGTLAVLSTSTPPTFVTDRDGRQWALGPDSRYRSAGQEPRSLQVLVRTHGPISAEHGPVRP